MDASAATCMKYANPVMPPPCSTAGTGICLQQCIVQQVGRLGIANHTLAIKSAGPIQQHQERIEAAEAVHLVGVFAVNPSKPQKQSIPMCYFEVITATACHSRQMQCLTGLAVAMVSIHCPTVMTSTQTWEKNKIIAFSSVAHVIFVVLSHLSQQLPVLAAPQDHVTLLVGNGCGAVRLGA